jgi:PAS domain S-box-containing protein
VSTARNSKTNRSSPGDRERTQPSANKPQGNRRLGQLLRGLSESPQEQANLLDEILSATPDQIYVYDRDGKCLYASLAAARSLGLDRDEIVGKSWQNIGFPPQRTVPFDALLRDVFDTGRSLCGEASLPSISGLRSLEYVLTPYHGAESDVQLTVCTVRDITDRKRSEDALRSSEELLRLFVHNTPAPVAMFDREMRYLLVSKRWLSDYHLEGQDIVGRSHYDLVPDIPERWREAHRRGLSGNVESCEEDRWERSDGTVEWLRWEVHPWWDKAGQVGGILLFSELITDRKKAEEAKQELLNEVNRRAAELDATISAIVEGVAIFDATGRLVQMNPALEEMLGLTHEQAAIPLDELIALLRMETTQGEPFPPERQPIVRALREGVVAREMIVLHPPGRPAVWVSNTAAPIRAADGKLLGAVSTASNVTVLHDLQEQRTQYILGISHGLRTPLTAIQGQAQLLLHAMDRAQVDGRMHRSAQVVIASARRMSIMLRDLVDLMQLEAGLPLRMNLITLDLRSFVLSLEERLTGLLDVNRVRVDAPDDLPDVRADADRLERILVNLLSNALKYSEPGTEVILRLEERDGEVVTTVIDRGKGISKAQLETLFQPYQRLRLERAPKESVGLGLYITKGSVEALGGRIEVRSEPDKGSSVSFTLPIA